MSRDSSAASLLGHAVFREKRPKNNQQGHLDLDRQVCLEWHARAEVAPVSLFSSFAPLRVQLTASLSRPSTRELCSGRHPASASCRETSIPASSPASWPYHLPLHLFLSEVHRYIISSAYSGLTSQNTRT